MPEPVYRRLTPRKRSLLGYTQLWLADDHVLLVNSRRFSENYQRFRLADIQAISVTGGPDVFVFQILGGLAAIGWGLLALFVDAEFGKWFFAITGLLGLLIAIYDIARGPRCRCLLYTAVSQLRLRPVSRQSIAQSALAMLAPAIEALQGAPAEGAPMEVPSTAAGVTVPPPQPKSGFRAIQVLFAMYLLDAALAGLGYRFPRFNATLIFPLSILGELMLATVAVAQAAGRSFGLSGVLAIVGGACGIYDLVRLVGLVIAAVDRGVLERGTPPDFGAILGLPPKLLLFAVGWRVAAGALGLLLLAASRGEESKA